MSKPKHARQISKNWHIRASAPCRIDVGGTWDLKAFALPYEYIKPSTVNFALNLRTNVELLPYKPGLVKISDRNAEEVYHIDEAPFDTNFRLMFAIVSYFQLHGLEIKITYEGPPRSGLGGSGVLAVCTVSALDRARHIIDPKTKLLSKQQIIQIAHDIEDGLHFSHTGLQDQCGAAYGGINHWVWNYTSPLGKFSRIPVMDKESHGDFSSRLLVAYVGQTHVSNEVNKEQVASFQSGKTRSKWLRIKDLSDEFAKALNRGDWTKASKIIQEENDIRLSMVPRRITPVGEKLQEATREVGGGFAIAGAGNGGCVWAICPKIDQQEELRSAWANILSEVKYGQVLDVDIDNVGLLTKTFPK